MNKSERKLKILGRVMWIEFLMSLSSGLMTWKLNEDDNYFDALLTLVVAGVSAVMWLKNVEKYMNLNRTVGGFEPAGEKAEAEKPGGPQVMRGRTYKDDPYVGTRGTEPFPDEPQDPVEK